MSVKDLLAILAQNSKCGCCGSENVYGIITPCPLEFKSKPFIKANSKRGIMFICDDCRALMSIGVEEIENQ